MMQPSIGSKIENQGPPDAMELDELPTNPSCKTQAATAKPPPPSQEVLSSGDEKENTTPAEITRKEKNYRFDMSTMHLTDSQMEELCCLRLRFSFGNEQFSNFYMDLLKAGWTYVAHEQKYLPPDASKEDANNLLTAKEVQQHLDYFSLAGTIVSDLWDASKKPVPKLAAGQEERWRRLRDDVICHHYERRLKSPSNSDMDKDDTETTNRTTARAKNTTTTSDTTNTRRQPPRQARISSSITEVDHGAGMYMNKDKIQAKEKAKKKSLIAAKQQQSTDEDDSAPFERLSLEECISKGKEYSNLPQVEKNEAKYKEHFKDWRFLLGTNHSILLYGFGSKRPLLNEFAEKELSKEGYALTLDGFDPEITMEGILSLLVEMCLDGIEPSPLTLSLPGFENEDFTKLEKIQKDDTSNQPKLVVHYRIKDPLQRAQAIAHAIVPKLAEKLFPLFLVVHNLEGLQNRTDQEILSTLVANGKTENKIPVIRLVASIDDVDAPAVLWNEKSSTNFRWIWQEVHTYRPHTDELVLLAPDEIKTTASGKKRKPSGRQPKAFQGADRLMDVLKNLATRYTEVMQNLATLQLQVMNPGNQKAEWVDVAQLLQQCLNKCTVKCENQLRNFLVELEDHEGKTGRLIYLLVNFVIPSNSSSRSHSPLI
jgi:origin recognition complex subunit 2